MGASESLTGDSDGVEKGILGFSKNNEMARATSSRQHRDLDKVQTKSSRQQKKIHCTKGGHLDGELENINPSKLKYIRFTRCLKDRFLKQRRWWLWRFDCINNLRVFEG